MNRVVIIGAGQAGAKVATTLRAKGFEGAITLIGQEQYLPYQRPPLSKAVLQGKAQAEDGQFHSKQDYADKNIELYLGCHIDAVNIENRQVSIKDGAAIDFDELVFATGAMPRVLNVPGSELDNVLTLRDADDAMKIRSQLSAGKQVVIVGGGFIGLEVAASARQLGCEVTVLEVQQRLLSRSLPNQVADAVVSIHKAEGVTIKTGVNVTQFNGAGQVDSVTLNDGSTLPTQLVVVGAGIIPATELAQLAGIEVDNGILTNESGQTSVEHIYAIGDCARAYLPRYGQQIRLESFQNANMQAANAATTILGEKTAYDPVPFVWSDQYSKVLQTVGFPALGDQHIQRGTLEDGNLVFFSLRDGGLIGVSGWGKAGLIVKDVRFSQMLMEKGKLPTPEQLSDPTVKIKDLLTA